MLLSPARDIPDAQEPLKPPTRTSVDGAFLWAPGSRSGDGQRHASAATDHHRTCFPSEGPAAPPRNFPRETRDGPAMPTRGRVCGFRSTLASEEVTSNATHQPPELRPGTHVPSPKEGPADPGPRSRPDDRPSPKAPRPKALSIRFGGFHRMRTRHPCQKAFHLAANLPSGRGFLRQPGSGFARRFDQQPDRLRNHHACACSSNFDELQVKVQ